MDRARFAAGRSAGVDRWYSRGASGEKTRLPLRARVCEGLQHLAFHLGLMPASAAEGATVDFFGADAGGPIFRRCVYKPTDGRSPWKSRPMRPVRFA